MERRIINIVTIGIAVLMTSCYYDAEEIRNPTDCDTANMSYQNNIEPIFLQTCYSCHSISAAPGSGNNIILEGYSEVIKYVESEQLLGAIKHQPGFSFMPKDASSLSNCNIAKIEQWILEGYPDN